MSKMNRARITVCAMIFVVALALYGQMGTASLSTTSTTIIWHNISLDVMTQSRVSGTYENTTNFNSTDLANITIGIVNNDRPFNTSYINGSLLIEVSNSSGIVYYYANDTTIEMNANSASFHSYVNDFDNLTTGNYTVNIRFVHSYPDSNETLLNATGHETNISRILNLSYIIAAPPPEPDPDVGPGRVVPPVSIPKISYVLTDKYDLVDKVLQSGDKATYQFEVKNPTVKSEDTDIKIFILKDAKLIDSVEKSVTTGAGKSSVFEMNVYDVICSSPAGEYKVRVEWYSGTNRRYTSTANFNVGACADLTLDVSLDKIAYAINDTAELDFSFDNKGNQPIEGSVEVLFGSEEIESYENVRISPEKSFNDTLEINLTGYDVGAYEITVKMRVISGLPTTKEGEETIIEEKVTLLISPEAAALVGVALWLVGIAVVVLMILAYMEIWRERRVDIVAGKRRKRRKT